jgi:hypothetical protein
MNRSLPIRCSAGKTPRAVTIKTNPPVQTKQSEKGLIKDKKMIVYQALKSDPDSGFSSESNR